MHLNFIIIYWNACNLMIYQLYLNGLLGFFTFVLLSQYIHKLIYSLWTYKSLFKCCILHLFVYILKHTQQLNVSHLYLNGLMHLFTSFNQHLKYQHLHMNWIIHFECVNFFIHELHFAFITIFWYTCIKNWWVPCLYLNGLLIRSRCASMQILLCM